MPPEPAQPRRFNLGDLLIVVVAAAVGFALARRSWSHPIYCDRPIVLGGPTRMIREPTDLAATALETVVSGWIVGTATLLTLRARRPHPRWRRLMCQPGWVATWAALLAVVVALGGSSLYDYNFDLFDAGGSGVPIGQYCVEIQTYRLTLAAHDAPRLACLAIAVAWGLLALSGRWRSERSWLDRTGRLLALGWLGLLAARVYLDLRP